MTATVHQRAPTPGAAAIAVVLMAAALLGACASPPPAPLSYRCADGMRFSLAVDDEAGGARIAFAGMEFGLRREPSASGLRYACDVLSVWIGEDAAQLDIQGRVRECRPAP